MSARCQNCNERTRLAHSGFTLMELLIVVAIIGILAAIAVPAMLRARRTANEAAAIGSLRALNSAESSYAAAAGKGGFAPLLATLATPCPGSTAGVHFARPVHRPGREERLYRHDGGRDRFLARADGLQWRGRPKPPTTRPQCRFPRAQRPARVCVLRLGCDFLRSRRRGADRSPDGARRRREDDSVVRLLQP